MLLKTKAFGELEIEESGLITFEEGLPGFRNSRRYTILGSGGDDSPFKWLQCMDDANLAFAVVDPFAVKKDYDIKLNDSVVKALELEGLENVLIYSILVVPEDVSKMTMNLKAPVVINTKNKKGMQVILDTEQYSVRHYVLEELHGREVSGDACADSEKGPDNSDK